MNAPTSVIEAMESYLRRLRADLQDAREQVGRAEHQLGEARAWLADTERSTAEVEAWLGSQGGAGQEKQEAARSDQSQALLINAAVSGNSGRMDNESGSTLLAGKLQDPTIG